MFFWYNCLIHHKNRESRVMNRHLRLTFAVAIVSSVSILPTPPHAAGLLDQVQGTVGNLLGGSTGNSATSALTNSDIADGLLEALRVGTERVVAQVGTVDGYNSDAAIHIPLPENLKKVQSALRTIGYSSLADDLELKLNRAAEAAAPEAKELFWNTISGMSFEDVQGIYNGPDDAATRYFQQKMTPDLTTRMEPIIDSTLSEVGAIKAYDAMMGQYDTIPYMPDVKADLNSYAVEKAMDGLFHYVAIEEAAIRNDPVARTTDILKKVFGG